MMAEARRNFVPLVAMWFAAGSCLAGSNITSRAYDFPDNVSRPGSIFRAVSYLHGTNEVLKIVHRAPSQTSISSSCASYTVTQTDEDGDGIFESIMLSLTDGPILEVLKRDSDGTYTATPQKDLDEMNRIKMQIEEHLSPMGGKEREAPNKPPERYNVPRGGAR